MRETTESRQAQRVTADAVPLLATNDMLEIVSLISKGEPLEKIFQRIVDAVADSFNMKCVSLSAVDDSGMFVPMALHGFSVAQTLAIKRHAYSLERTKMDLDERFRVAPNCYYVRAEDQEIAHDDDLDFVIEPEKIDSPREMDSDWHELDYICILMKDRLGNWMGWLEIDQPGDGKVPQIAVLDNMRVCAELAAVAIENSRLYDSTIESVIDAQSYLGIIVNDFQNLVNPLLYYMNEVALASDDDSRNLALTESAIGVARKMKMLVNDVKTLAELRQVEGPPSETVNLKEVLEKSAVAIRHEHPTKNVQIDIACPDGAAPVLADHMANVVFLNLFDNCVSRARDKDVSINVTMNEGHSACTVTIEDHGKGIPDDLKETLLRGLSDGRTRGKVKDLGMAMVGLLMERYDGLVLVRDRVPGNLDEGACFEVAFPSAAKGDG